MGRSFEIYFYLFYAFLFLDVFLSIPFHSIHFIFITRSDQSTLSRSRKYQNKYSNRKEKQQLKRERKKKSLAHQ